MTPPPLPGLRQRLASACSLLLQHYCSKVQESVRSPCIAASVLYPLLQSVIVMLIGQARFDTRGQRWQETDGCL